MSRTVRWVTHYVFATPGGAVMLAREDWWDGSLVEIDGKKYIRVNPEQRWLGHPDLELLDCGHEQPPRRFGRHQYFNLRRRCDQCALTRSVAVARLENVRRCSA